MHISIKFRAISVLSHSTLSKKKIKEESNLNAMNDDMNVLVIIHKHPSRVFCKILSKVGL